MAAVIAKQHILEQMTNQEIDFHSFFCNLEYVKYSIQKGKVYDLKTPKVLEKENKFSIIISGLSTTHKNTWDVITPDKRSIKYFFTLFYTNLIFPFLIL